MATVKQVLVPDLGDFADVPIIEVMVNPGDTVSPEDPLVTIESDKATMDVPSPFGGVVQELKVKTGDTVSKGSLLLTLDVGGDGAPGAGAEGDVAAAAAAETTPAAEPGAADTVVTALQAEEGAEPGPAPRAQPDPAQEAPAAPRPTETEPTPAAHDGPLYASPGVRRLARELGVDLGRVTGSGRKGRILKEDVERYSRTPATPARPAVPQRPAAAPAPAGAGLALDLPAWPDVDFAKHGEVERVPLSRIKRISGPALHRNWVSIPHVTHYDEADVTELEAFRKQANEAHAKEGVKVTMVALMVRAVVATLQAFPTFNSSLVGDELILKRYHHIGFAVDTPDGLVVPVIRDADRKGILEIARDLGELSAKARSGKLTAADMQGGTFSISSLGGIGGTAFTPLINAPEVAILGVARTATRPVWDGTNFRPRLIVPLCLSYDHRAIDGAEGARFCAHLVEVLIDLRRALL